MRDVAPGLWLWRQRPMARLAGMTLRERWGGWRREPFSAESTEHVSVWEKTASASGAEEARAER